MTFRDYEIFCTVFEEESISRAAKKLMLSLPSVSNVLHQMEGAVGSSLFIRGGTSLIPTDKAYALYSTAKQILTLQQAIINGTENTKREVVCRAGFYSSFADGPLLALLEHVSNFSEFRMKPTISNSHNLAQLLKSGNLDFILTDYYIYDKELIAYPIFEDTLTFVSSDTYPITPDLTLEQLANLPLIIREPGTGDFYTVSLCFIQNHLYFQPWITVSTSSPMIPLVRAGHGICCLSYSYYNNLVDSTGLRQLQWHGPELKKTRYLIVQKGLLPVGIRSVINETVLFLHESENNAEYAHIIPWKKL